MCWRGEWMGWKRKRIEERRKGKKEGIGQRREGKKQEEEEEAGGKDRGSSKTNH